MTMCGLPACIPGRRGGGRARGASVLRPLYPRPEGSDVAPPSTDVYDTKDCIKIE